MISDIQNTILPNEPFIKVKLIKNKLPVEDSIEKNKVRDSNANILASINNTNQFGINIII